MDVGADYQGMPWKARRAWTRQLSEILSIDPVERTLGGRAGGMLYIFAALSSACYPLLPGSFGGHLVWLYLIAATSLAWGLFSFLVIDWESLNPVRHTRLHGVRSRRRRGGGGVNGRLALRRLGLPVLDRAVCVLLLRAPRGDGLRRHLCVRAGVPAALRRPRRRRRLPFAADRRRHRLYGRWRLRVDRQAGDRSPAPAG